MTGAGVAGGACWVIVVTTEMFLLAPCGTGGAWLRRSPMLGLALVLAEEVAAAEVLGLCTVAEMTAPIRSW